jgi:hypothetical protein
MKMLLALMAIFMTVGIKVKRVEPWVLALLSILILLVVLLTFLNF